MENNLMVIGIDSLDPYVILKYRKELPTFSKLIDESPTFISKSVFPVDTIPAWISIYTGLHPRNHGVLYVYDIFDPNLSDLKKLDISHIKGRTFWDYASQEGYRTVVVYPMLMYPAWVINGVMVGKSPFDRRLDWLRTEVDIDIYPEIAKEKYGIPDKLESLWGGFPGVKHLSQWAELGKKTLEEERKISLDLCKDEKWNMFFVYFNLLDIIQHRLWRFFDKNDPTYPGQSSLSGVISEYYKIFDGILEEFMEMFPDVSLIVMSDHGHGIRPYKTVNINEYLRKKRYLISKDKNKKVMSKIMRIVLEVANRLDVEHWLIKLVVKSQKLIKASKSMYSSAGSIDENRSIAHLSNFAGIKSYPHGGIEINRDLVSEIEYERIRKELVKSLSELKTPDGRPIVKWIRTREEYSGKFTEEIYPDIVFGLKDDYGVGWGMYTNLYGKAYDHKVASGGHSEDAVFLIKNIGREIRKKRISVVDIAPTMLDFLDINWRRFNFDGESICG